MTDEWLIPPIKILIVEDHEDNAQSVAELLNLAGGDTCIARNAQDALIAAGREAPDVVLIEPLIRDGWNLARQLRLVANPKLIIVVSSSGDEEDLLRSLAVGIDRHLVKPVAPLVLLDELRRVKPEH